MIPRYLPTRIRRFIALLFYFIVVITALQFFIDWSQDKPLFGYDYTVETPVTWDVFESEIRPISIQYPKGWIAENKPRGQGSDKEIIAVLEPFHPASYPWVYIANRKMPPDSTLETVAEWGEERLSEVKYETTSLEQITINKEPALLRRLYYINSQSERVDCFYVYLVNNLEGYTIALCTDERNNSSELQVIWEQMIASISIK